jgi:glycosyltransferase involved in cell wall biosynthesis
MERCVKLLAFCRGLLDLGRLCGLRALPAGSVSDRLRVLFLWYGEFLPESYAGTELTTHYLCRSLLERGHLVAVAACSNHPELGVEAAKCDHDCGYSVYRARRFSDAANRSIAEFQPDAVVCHEPGYWHFDRLEDLSAIAILLYQHSRHDGMTTIPAPIRQRAAYISNSAQTAAFLKNNHDINSVIIPPVFGIDRFLGLEPHGKNVLFVGMQLRKGADIAIDIARAKPEVDFVFVESWTQNPKETAELRHSVVSLPNVRLLPNQPDLGIVFRTTRLLLMPSRSHEGWGRTATEAQLCGIPVLGSSRGQLESTIGPGGLALDPDEGISLWLRAFDSIWNDEAYYRVLSRRAKDHAARLIQNKDEVVERFEAYLISAVKRERLAGLRMPRLLEGRYARRS